MRYPGGAAVVCLLAAVLCGSSATVMSISDVYCWWAFVVGCVERRKTRYRFVV